MSAGVFSCIGTSYIKAAKNTFYFTKRGAPFLLKPFALVFALFYSVTLLMISKRRVRPDAPIKNALLHPPTKNGAWDAPYARSLFLLLLIIPKFTAQIDVEV